MAQSIPIEHDIVIYQGHHFALTVTLTLPAGLDLNDYSAIGEIRKQRDPTSELLATFSGSIDVDDLAVTYTLGAVASAAVDESGFYEGKIVHNSDSDLAKRIVFGRATLELTLID